jgi:RNA polymerase sigma-70 factor (ECF subfamily)
MANDPRTLQARLDGLRTGDRAAFDAIYDAYYDRLWRFAFGFVRTRDVAQEVVHDIFLALWTQRASLDVRGSLDTYLYGATRNRALNVVRHDRVVERERDLAAAAHVTYGMGEYDGDAQGQLERHELAAVIDRALERLTERQRTAVILRWQNDLGYDEIGHVLGISSQAARTLVLRVHDTMRRIVGRLL